MKTNETIDSYIETFPEKTQEMLSEIRKIAHELAPDAGEKISYGVPTLTLNGKYFMYFAGFKSHISIYPVFDQMDKSIKGLSEFRAGKGTLRFLLNKPLPISLIRKIIQELKNVSLKRNGSK